MESASPQGNKSWAEMREKVLNAFEGHIPPQPVPLHYRLGLVLVTVCMVMLPLVYIGLIALLGWGLYYHAIHSTAVFEHTGGRGSGKGAVLVYFGPLIAGGILLLFMIKPLFARRAKQAEPRRLIRAQEPLLFAFVERVCAAVGAPAPREIHVDCEVNASASFRGGIFSFFGNDLVLTIGMPLAAGLTLKQFAGVLAHEFGHFAQQAGMRLTYVIRAVSFWFARVVYERDALDEALVSWSREIDIRIGVIFYVARFFVWLTRKILWLLMVAGHAISCFMLRQMEYDADRHEAWLAGGDAFEATVRRLAVLSVATRGAHSDLKHSWDEGRLADDFPALIAANLKQIPKELHKKIEEHIRENKTGLFDTHPADADRIASARATGAKGIFHSDLPASAIFSDFGRACRDVSTDFYKDALGPTFSPKQICPVAVLIGRQDKEQEANKALERWFQERISVLRPVTLPGIFLTPHEDPRAAVAALGAGRASMAGAQGRYKVASQRYAMADKVMQATKLVNGTFRVDPEQFELPRVEPAQAGSLLRQAAADQEKLAAELEPFEKAAGERMFAALRLLHDPALSAKIENAAALREEAGKMLPVAVMLGRLLPALIELRHSFQSLMALLAHVEGNENNEQLIGSVRSRAMEIERKLRAIRDKLGDVPYPFDHAKGTVSLREFAAPRAPSSEDLDALIPAAEEALTKLFPLYFRILGRLALAAEKVEIAIGLPVLADLPEEVS